MNIKITKDEHLELTKINYLGKQLIGSRLYGTNSKESDYDYLCFYFTNLDWDNYSQNYPSQHQFQYDCEKSNSQYIWTSVNQFWRNLYSGDSTINADVILFSDFFNVPKLETVRCYKVIKAYLGFAKRDLKNPKGKNKLFHAKRSLYIAECLIGNELPNLEMINFINRTEFSLTYLNNIEKVLRKRCNEMYQKGELQTYSIPSVQNPLLQKLLDSNNQKEFRYD